MPCTCTCTSTNVKVLVLYLSTFTCTSPHACLEGNICGKTFAVEPNLRKPRQFSPSNVLSYIVYGILIDYVISGIASTSMPDA